jgi:hypothetical protein
MREFRRYSIVRGTVSGRQHYGLLVTLESGDRGFVDVTYVSDESQPAAEWPETGRPVEAVVLGTTRDDRVRLCTRATDLEFVRSADDPAGAFEAWQAIGETVESGDASSVSPFLDLPDADALLSWALRQSPRSADVGRALGILARSPRETRQRHLHRVSRLATDAIHADKAREILALDG